MRGKANRRYKMNKRTKLLCAAVSAALLLSGCGTPESPPVSVSDEVQAAPEQYVPDIRDLKWGMTVDEVKSHETAPITGEKHEDSLFGTSSGSDDELSEYDEPFTLLDCSEADIFGHNAQMQLTVGDKSGLMHIGYTIDVKDEDELETLYKEICDGVTGEVGERAGEESTGSVWYDREHDCIITVDRLLGDPSFVLVLYRKCIKLDYEHLHALGVDDIPAYEAPAETTAAVTAAENATTTSAVNEAEKEPEPAPVRIELSGHTDDRRLTSRIDSYHLTESLRGENVIFYSGDYEDKVDVVNYRLDDSTSHISESEGSYETLVMNADAAKLKVRSSTNSFSDKEDNDIAERVVNSMFGDAAKFGSAYEIKYDDPTVVMKLSDEGSDYQYSEGNDITLGYTIDAPVTVNAFVCDKDDETISILIDPEYMYGLPMFNETDITFLIGNTEVTSDSLLFTGTPVEGLSLDTADYAYAKVTMLDTHVVYSKKSGCSSTCTVSDIEIVKTFKDISELDFTNDTDILSGEDKDPEMLEVYNTVMDAKDELYNEDTLGLLLLDLDFDGKPEVISSSLVKVNENKTRIESTVYRIKDGKLVFIDKLYPARTTGEGSFGAYLGLSRLKDGTPAWHMTKMIPNDENEYNDEDYDYLYTLDGDKLNEYPLFTRVTIKEPSNEGNDYFPGEYKYYFYDEEIVPNVTMGKDPYLLDDPDAPEDYEYLDWHDIHATFGMWELFGFIRADFCDSITSSYRLSSPWITAYNGYDLKRYNITDREFAHKIAYMVDDCYYGRNNGVEHNYWFLGAYAKPVIYLYPEEKTDVSVQVGFTYGGRLTCTYPDYGEGWKVTAMPDGTLYDADGNEYYCLYWEGDGAAGFDMSKGFCVAGKDTASFLREKLMYIGLTAREANEFIIYWLPKLQDNAYNVITLHTDDYARSVPLSVSPAPDTQIRVFMTYYASETPVDIPEQELPHYERNGFTLTEWGGSEN